MFGQNGSVAEWLGRGLQNLVQRFESARNLSDYDCHLAILYKRSRMAIFFAEHPNKQIVTSLYSESEWALLRTILNKIEL